MKDKTGGIGGRRKRNKFVDSVINGDADMIRGISSKRFDLRVVQQPKGRAGFVSTMKGVVTQFSMPNKYNVIGMLAHNYLSGKYFYDLEIGDTVQLVYGDGDIKKYRVNDIRSYQALQPTSPTSNFMDLETKEKLSASQLFKREYMGKHHLTLQVCIRKNSESAWGRYFVNVQPI